MRNFLLTAVFIPFVAFADGKDSEGKGVVDKSAASFDKRLPPVIPGETIRDNEDRKIKVWSSTGPVVGQKAPDAPQAAGSSSGIPAGTTVIVDQREEEKKHY